MFAEPEFWVAVGFVILLGVFAYVGVHRTVLTALDHRRDRIKSELDDARRLKDEAAKLLAEYKARHASAEREAQDIITSAKAEAERIAAEAKTKMEDFVARRTKTAEGKIALAEAQALADVRAAAADAAVTAASSILTQTVKGSVADDLLTKGITEVREKLNCRPFGVVPAAGLFLVPHRLWFRLRRQRLRIEADIEDVGIADGSRRHRIDQVFRHQAERHAAFLVHRHRGAVDLGRNRPLLHPALHHRDAKRNFDRRRVAGRPGNDAAEDADPRRDLVAGLGAVARGAGDR